MKKTMTLLLAALTILVLTACTATAETFDRTPPPISQPAAEVPAAQPVVPQPEPVPVSAPVPEKSELTLEDAQAIALAHAGLTAQDVTYVHAHRDHDDGRKEYEIEFLHGNQEYDYDIGALTGEIRSFDTELEHRAAPSAETAPAEPVAPAEPQTSEMLTESEVRTLALAHAGLTEKDVRFEKVQLDKDSRTWEYDIEFRAGRTEYEYEIHAFTGDILDYDKDYDD